MKTVFIMDMPEDCGLCPLIEEIHDPFGTHDGECYCRANGRDLRKKDKDKRPDWCPLPELPDSGLERHLKALTEEDNEETTKAFYDLLKSLDMEFVCDENTDYGVCSNGGELAVYSIRDGIRKLHDDRGELFVALRNTAVQIFPNMAFRSADYIYHWDEGGTE